MLVRRVERVRDPGLPEEASQDNLLVSHGAASYTCPARCYPRVGYLFLASHTMYSIMFLTFIRDRTLGLDMSNTPARWIWVCASFVLVCLRDSPPRTG